MPTTRIEYLALSSSPGGLEADWTAIGLAMEEVNTTLNEDGIGIRLVSWKLDVAPTITADAQNHINEQIVNTADIIIAILHVRAGSSTGRYRSGTMEEVEIFLDRKSKGDNVEAFILFKNEPVVPSELDIEQLSAVIDFKMKVKDCVFFKEYSDIMELSKFIRTFMPSVVRKLDQVRRGIRVGPDDLASLEAMKGRLNEHNINEIDDTDVEGEERGIIDIQIEFYHSAELLKSSLEKMTETHSILSQNLKLRTNELKALSTYSSSPLDKKVLIDVVASDIEAANDVLEVSFVDFSTSAESMSTVVNQMIAYIGVEIPATRSDVEGFADVIDSFVATISITIVSVRSQIETVASMPRMTSRLNRAKKRQIRLTQYLVDAMSNMVGRLTISANHIRERAKEFA